MIGCGLACAAAICLRACTLEEGGSRLTPSRLTLPVDKHQVRRLLTERNGGLAVPHNFVPTAPAFDPAQPQMRSGRMPTVSARGVGRNVGRQAAVPGWLAGWLAIVHMCTVGGEMSSHYASDLPCHTFGHVSPPPAHPCPHPASPLSPHPQRAVRNPQTEAFLEALGLPYNLDHGAEAAGAGPAGGGGWGGAGEASAGSLGEAQWW